jgi:hypothetical protein
MYVWRRDGVEKNGVLLAQVQEPIQCMVEGRGGKERCSFRTRKTILVCMMDGKVEKVVCSHVPEQKFCIKEAGGLGSNPG